jgi:hypothetical protein
MKIYVVVVEPHPQSYYQTAPKSMKPNAENTNEQFTRNHITKQHLNA